MGTSSARRGPTTALWRAAKGAATRYLSPEAGGEVSAREVVARYLAALEETPGQGDGVGGVPVYPEGGSGPGGLLGRRWRPGGGKRPWQDRGLAPLARGCPGAAGARG